MVPAIFTDDSWFYARIKKLLPEGASWHDVTITETGLALLFHNNKPYIFGCPLCIEGLKGQDEMGNPTIGGAAMLCALDAPELLPADAPHEVNLNLWLCPRCHKPDLSHKPQFVTSWMPK